jgi:hypothetical protein
MKITAIGVFAVLALSFVCPFQALSDTEERFGPWLYYAPYYFPPDRCCLGYCFSADEFRPVYESPNPPQPRNDAPPQCAPAPPPSKTGSRLRNLAHEAQQTPLLKPMLSNRGNLSRSAAASRPISSSAIKPQTDLTRSGGKHVTGPSARKGSQPGLINPPAPGPQGRQSQ